MASSVPMTDLERGGEGGEGGREERGLSHDVMEWSLPNNAQSDEK